MTTIVNTPPTNDESGGYGFLLGIIILVGFTFSFLYFGIPAFQRMQPVQVNVDTPEINVPAPEVKVAAPEVKVEAPVSE
jgi:hypothetical protein